MTAREQFEQEALAAIQREVLVALPELRSRGFDLGSLDVSRQGRELVMSLSFASTRFETARSATRSKSTYGAMEGLPQVSRS